MHFNPGSATYMAEFIHQETLQFHPSLGESWEWIHSSRSIPPPMRLACRELWFPDFHAVANANSRDAALYSSRVVLFFFLEAGLKVETCSCFGSNLPHYQFVCICTLTKAVGRVVVSSICKPVDCFHLFLMWSLTPATTCRWNDWFKMPESEVERQEQLSLLHVLPIPSAGNNVKKKLVLARKNRLRLEGSRFDCNWIHKLMHEESDSLSSFFVLIPSSSCIDYIFDLRDRPLLEARNCLIACLAFLAITDTVRFFQFVSLGIGCLDAMPTGLTLQLWPLSFVCFYSENAEFWDT